MDELAGALAALVIFAFIAFVIWIQFRNRQAQRQLVLERQKSLLDRVGSGTALGELLASDNGARLLAHLSELDQTRSNPRHSIAATVTTGIVATCAGIGLLVAARVLGPFFDSDYWQLVAFGLLAIGVGVGLLIASAFTYYLSKKWGLIKE